MIKVEKIDQSDGIKIYVEGSSEQDIDSIDEIYKVIMSTSPKLGGYESSLKFNVLLLHPESAGKVNVVQ